MAIKSFQISDEDSNRITEAAWRQKISQSKFIRDAVTEKLEREKMMGDDGRQCVNNG